MKKIRVTGPRYSNIKDYDKRVIKILEQEILKEALNRDNFLLNINKDDIAEIGIEIAESYKGIFLKKKDRDIIFDEVPLYLIAVFIVTSQEYYLLLNKLMQYKRKDKNDFQILTTYLNAIAKVIMYSTSSIVKTELIKESEELLKLKDMYQNYLGSNELEDLINVHNTFILHDNSRDILSGSVPKNKLKHEHLQSLKNFIDKIIYSSIIKKNI